MGRTCGSPTASALKQARWSFVYLLPYIAFSMFAGVTRMREGNGSDVNNIACFYDVNALQPQRCLCHYIHIIFTKNKANIFLHFSDSSVQLFIFTQFQSLLYISRSTPKQKTAEQSIFKHRTLPFKQQGLDPTKHVSHHAFHLEWLDHLLLVKNQRPKENAYVVSGM